MYILNISRSNPTTSPIRQTVPIFINFISSRRNVSISSLISVNPYQSHFLFYNNISQFLLRYFRFHRTTPPPLSISLFLFNNHENSKHSSPDPRCIIIFLNENRFKKAYKSSTIETNHQDKINKE